MLTTTHKEQPIFWNGHLCEGDQMVPFDRGTFILWTRCGKHDVPAGEGHIGPKAPDDVECEDCLRVLEGDVQ